MKGWGACGRCVARPHIKPTCPKLARLARAAHGRLALPALFHRQPAQGVGWQAAGASFLATCPLAGAAFAGRAHLGTVLYAASMFAQDEPRTQHSPIVPGTAQPHVCRWTPNHASRLVVPNPPHLASLEATSGFRFSPLRSANRSLLTCRGETRNPLQYCSEPGRLGFPLCKAARRFHHHAAGRLEGPFGRDGAWTRVAWRALLSLSSAGGASLLRVRSDGLKGPVSTALFLCTCVLGVPHVTTCLYLESLRSDAAEP